MPLKLHIRFRIRLTPSTEVSELWLRDSLEEENEASEI